MCRILLCIPALLVLCAGAPAQKQCSHARCACLASKAAMPLKKTYRMALKLAVSAETGIVERGEFEDSSATAGGDGSDSKDASEQKEQSDS